MIINFWKLPEERNYVILKPEFKNELIKEYKKKKSIKEIAKILNCSRHTVKQIEKNDKIKIKNIINLSKIINKKEFSLENIEKNIIWIGHPLSKGIENPKLPFDFNNRESARLIAAIYNDGCITKGSKKKNNKFCYGKLMYDNFEKDLRMSIKKDALNILGGKEDSIKEFEKESRKYIVFPSITRDILELIIKHKGRKSEKNLNVPKFITKNNDLIYGWIEQTVADEGEVKYDLLRYRRSIVWRRSLDITKKFPFEIFQKEAISIRKLPKKIQEYLANIQHNLIKDETRMLDKIGITYKTYNLGIYFTKDKKIKTRWQIGITRRNNLIKLRKLIKIPQKNKEKKFTAILKEFKRYKEIEKIKNKLIKIQNRKNSITSKDLAKEMKYKTQNTACNWLKRMKKEGFLKCVKKSKYGGCYRSCAHYIILEKKD